jgi:hypothetical protein
MKRLFMVADAISQLFNVAFLPNVHETTANESISGRAYRQGWTRTQRFIDWLFFLVESEHCKQSHYADVKRAKDLLNGK